MCIAARNSREIIFKGLCLKTRKSVVIYTGSTLLALQTGYNSPPLKKKKKKRHCFMFFPLTATGLYLTNKVSALQLFIPGSGS